LRIRWHRFERERHNPRALAAVRQGAREGTLLDVASERDFIEILINNLRSAETVEEGGTRLEFRPTGELLKRPTMEIAHVHAVETEQSNSTALVDNAYVVKIYRKLESGINPELEVGRFLTEVAGFANSPALLGGIELVEGERRSAVGIVHAFVQNQGDAWTVTSAYLDRFVEQERLLSGNDHPAENEDQLSYMRHMAQIGRRLAEMHVALASSDDQPDFKPEPVTPDEVSTWVDDVVSSATRTIDRLQNFRAKEQDRSLIDRLIAQRNAIRNKVNGLLSPSSAYLKIRHHGDFHLGQMLIVKDDIFIIDFEGEPRRSLHERRRKAPAARDVAGLIRSIDYSTTAALDRALKVAPDEQGKLTAALASWRDRSVAAFLAAYREHMSDSRLWPADAAAADQVLGFFLLEKAFYEIDYEIAHRPDWIRVPLTGALQILSQIAGGPR
jgi:maltose alpha-D-glucosyltransferase/alpha-amylase